MTFAAMSYSYYGSRSDHMDVLNRYREYKVFWDRHRIPGQHYNEILWEDPWWKAHNAHTKRRPRRLPPLKSAQKKIKEKRQATFIADKSKEKTPTESSTSLKQEEHVEETPQRTSTPKDEQKVVDVPTAEEEANVKESKISPASSRASSASSKISEKKEDAKSLSRKSSVSSISSKSSTD